MGKRFRVRNLKTEQYTDNFFTVAKSYNITSSGSTQQNALCKITPELNFEIYQVSIDIHIAGVFDSVRVQTQISTLSNLNRCYFTTASDTPTIDFGNTIKFPSGILTDIFAQFSGEKKDKYSKLKFERRPVRMLAGQTYYIHSFCDCEIASTIGILTKVQFYTGRCE